MAIGLPSIPMPTWRASPDDCRTLEGSCEDRNPFHQGELFTPVGCVWVSEFPHIGEQYCTAGRLKESAEFHELWLYQDQGGNHETTQSPVCQFDLQ